MALHDASGGEGGVEFGAGWGLLRRLQVAGGAVAGDEAAEPAAQHGVVGLAVAGHAAEGLAYATLSAAALVELEAVMIDGWMPIRIRADITRRTIAALNRIDLSGVEPPQIREGTVGAEARALGAAAIPLAQRYLIDPAALQG